MTKYFFRSK